MKQKNIKYRYKPGLSALICTLVLVLSSCASRTIKYADMPSKGPIVVLGDSLAAGYGVKEGESFIALLGKRLSIEITNLSTVGITTEAAKPKIKKEVLGLKPSLVIIELGGNDALQKVDPKATEANLQSMIEEVQQDKIPILLLGIKGGLTSDPLATIYQGLSKKYQTGYVANILDGILTSPSLKLDSVHPNALGHEKLADKVEPELRRILELQQKAQ